MLSTEFNDVYLEAIYKADIKILLDLFRDNIIFKLTGADRIQNDFKDGGKFYLEFNSRGNIHGQFLKISENEIILDWNVNGFNRRDESNTIVQITLIQEKENCKLIINHKNILSKESSEAKRKAWTEIFEDIGKYLNNNNQQ